MNILLHHRGGNYHIAGSFGGKKLSWISRSCVWLFMEIFSMKFGGVASFGGTSGQSMKVFSARPICKSIPLYAILKIGGH